MSDFPHLKLPYKVEGSYIHKKGGSKKDLNKTTADNKQNRAGHGQKLKDSVEKLKLSWTALLETKRPNGLSLPNENDIPVFLQIDTQGFTNIDSLQNWGITIISEEENGYIIGVSADGLSKFEANVQQFINEQGTYKNTASKVWEFFSDDSWRFEQLLKGDLKRIWSDLQDDIVYTVEIGVSCSVPNTKKYPVPQNFDTEDAYQTKIEEYKLYENELLHIRDERQILRESEIAKYIEIYGGDILEIWDNNTDAKYFKITISGKGLRDLVLTYQYLFEVNLPANYEMETETFEIEMSEGARIIAPDKHAPKVCIIDSGIQEGHRLIAPAINSNESKSYVFGDSSTADFVKLSGHGTKVAGAVLYPYEIPQLGDYKLLSNIQNARILDKNNSISDREFEPALIEKIVHDFNPTGTRIFNLSVAHSRPFSGTHMPPLAAAIDKVCHENDILFIVAAGNIKNSTESEDFPGIYELLVAGNVYPDYLNLNHSKIANPAVSSFALAVGSIGLKDFENDDYRAIAGADHISPFSRTGLGLWGNIKPDVVEYGGDYLKNKNSHEIKSDEATSVELVNSTLHNAPEYSRSDVGTSFSTPKVSYIASRLSAELPNESAQMYRALIIQSARLPAHCFNHPTIIDICHYGYGLPDVNRTLENNRNRITFIRSGNISARKADIYRINIPRELRGEQQFQILMEVTLASTAKTRSTRKGAHSYISTWLEWQSSSYNESFEDFRNKTITYLDIQEVQEEEKENPFSEGAIQWTIRENVQWGKVKGLSRQNSTVQKDWTIIEPYQFAESFNLAVIGHIGWDKNLENTIPYSLCVSFEVLGADINIYELLAEAQVQAEVEQEEQEV